ncbi:hypothetical protein PHYBLDRAFT_64828 [Phycomyces blakesleeanus NRRL 1555(-)]|uniref:Uncharacterized protein n=1 Tax=Phycomyces blakesleeanus (strain ATCC 8743b / DSM 1359 / FGSC 10004 / NBRC 33097 / NRRL 1555) TaxID=763407 RepID=A0A162UBM7_PHYB8|nr:hypothetical protein PHYBLDRAFT_64828 [Phycomyces blakesleeanus NRRL 1555(-)]OAD73873.1 hypothetical protein PHYBLDRAFT_64828 [Phycomyces blakesleeanus NRRL 1555(-)]|eukprot:XP_018291913.1 hypothetical protein PHYBLDRAFT_64828 [Phycomyces blakesleeanus NRRL 1555(-)]
MNLFVQQLCLIEQNTNIDFFSVYVLRELLDQTSFKGVNIDIGIFSSIDISINISLFLVKQVYALRGNLEIKHAYGVNIEILINKWFDTFGDFHPLKKREHLMWYWQFLNSLEHESKL